jgi:hypothetical protein
MSYLDNDKIKLNNLKDKTTNFFYERADKMQSLIDFLKRNKETILNIIIFGTIILVVLLIIFNIETVRVNRYLGKMVQSKAKNAFQSNNEFMDMNSNYRLCDFYVASAYKCYLPCTYYYDYASIEPIIKCIVSGARYLHFDIFPDTYLFNGGLRPDAEPVVCSGDEVGNWHYTTSVSFDEVCRIINVFALGNSAPNSQNIIVKEDTYNPIMNAKDPLFIHLSLKCRGQISVIDKCANILMQYFGNNLLAGSPELENFKYAYCGTLSNTNIALTPMGELMGKVIIICDALDENDIKDSKIFEITNISPNFGGTCRMNTYEQIRDTYDAKELTEYNRQNVTIVRPSEYSRDKMNYNFYTPWYMGCQFMSMNFTIGDQFIQNYLMLDNRFGSYSFALKPLELRYKPVTIMKPKMQNKNVSFAPDTLVTGYGSFIV